MSRSFCGEQNEYDGQTKGLAKSNINGAIYLRHQLCKINVYVAMNHFLKPLLRILKTCVIFDHDEIFTVIELYIYKIEIRCEILHCPPIVKVQPVLMLSIFAHYSWLNEHKDMKLR